MGRHSSPDQGHFYRSFFGWVGLWAMIALVTGIGVWFVVGFIAGSDVKDPLAGQSREQQVAEPETEPEPEPTVSGARIVNDEADDKETRAPAQNEKPEKKKGGGKLITEGVSVQVLDGTNDPAAAQAMGDKLSGLGYSVVTIEDSSVAYDQTTVFWSTEASRDAAVALAERFGWSAEAKPTNLADTVSLHVVVGADES